MLSPVFRHLHRAGLRLLAVSSLLAAVTPTPRTAAGPISDTAYPLLSQRALADRSVFFVYEDSDSGFNHGFPSGLFASDGNLGSIHVDPGCIDDPTAANGCSTDPNRIDRQRGTILRITFDPQGPGQYAGVNIEEPRNWGMTQQGVGYDLTGTTAVQFDVRCPTPGGIRAQFGVGDNHPGQFIQIPQSSSYTAMTISLSSLGLSAADLSAVHTLFSVAVNNASAPSGGTLLLDNIRFTPAPTAQQQAISFPLANQTFGVIPQLTANFPPDQVLRNLTTTYESSLTMLTLLARGDPDDLPAARSIADALDYALQHENAGDALPVSLDGSGGLHNGYESGDLGLFNDQGAGQGQKGQIRLAGFSGQNSFFVVLDGATGGNNAFAILALLRAYQLFGDARYLSDAREIGDWIYSNLRDQTGTGFGGYYLGYADGGVTPPKPLLMSKSVENNADIFAVFTALSSLDSADSAEWSQRAKIAGDFVMQMFDPAAGRFNAGTVPAGTPAGPGVQPTGASMGGDVINTADFLDSDTFTTFALAASPGYQGQIDWRRPVRYARDKFAQSVQADGMSYRGFNIVPPSMDPGSNGVAWEFTGQMVEVMRFADDLYNDAEFEPDVQTYLAQIRQAQLTAPFTDGQGVPASTLQNGDQLTPIEQTLNTPFQSIAERVGLAATDWAILADRGVSIFSLPLATFPSGLSMVSLPFDYGASMPDAAELFGVTSLHGVTPIAAYDPMLNNYRIYPNLPGGSGVGVSPGMGYWVLETAARPFAQIGQVVPSPFSETLSPGWNIIGDPFTTPLDLNSLRFSTGAQPGVSLTLQDAVNQGLVDMTFWTWDTAEQKYVQVSTISPYIGYWVDIPGGPTHSQSVTITFAQ